MNRKNIGFGFGLAGLGIILGSPKVQALDWSFNYDYTDNSSQIWNGEGTLSYPGSGNERAFILSNLSFTETSGSTTRTYSLDNVLQSNVYTNSTGNISEFELYANNPSYSAYDYGKFLLESPSPGNLNVVSYNSNRYGGSASAGSITFSPTAVPFEFSPGQGIALGLPLFIGLRMLKKPKALKKRTRVHEMINSRVNLFF